MEQESQTIELRIPSTTKLVSAALAVFVFCGRVFSSQTVSLLPDVVMRVVRPTYCPVAMALVLLALCRTRKSWGVAGACAVACAVGVLSLPYVKNNMALELLFLILCALAIGDSDTTPLIRVCFWAFLGSLVVVVVMDALCLSTAGWRKPNWYWVYAYGFGHPNSLGANLFSTLAALTLVTDRRRFWLPLLLCCVGTMLFTFFALSCRAATVLELLLAVAIAIEGLRPQWVARLESTRALPVFVALGTVALALIMLVGMVFYDKGNALFSLMDRMTNLRISLGNQAYDYVGGFSLSGRVVTLPTQEESLTTGVRWILIDSAYIKYGLIVGLIPGLCLLAVFCRAAFVGREAQYISDSTMLWVVAGLGALYCAIETYPTSITQNCALLVIAWGLLPKAQKQDEAEAFHARPLQGGEDATPLQDNRNATPLPDAHPTPAPRPGLWVLGIAVFCAMLGFLTIQALGNGTGKLDVCEEFPHTTSISCSSALVADEFFSDDFPSAAAGKSNLNTLLQAEFCAGEQVQGEVLGNPIVGRITKRGTWGNAVRYLVSPADRDTDPIGGKWGIDLLSPGRGRPGTQEGRWALCMTDYEAKTTRSLWLDLGHDGIATFGCADLDVTDAKEEALRPFERTGTWETTERDGTTYVVCRFGDEQLSIAIEEEGE